MDHKNLMYKTFNTECVVQLSLILEQYDAELIYIQGSKKIAADALSRSDIADTPNPTKYCGLENEDFSHPANYKTIM